LRSSATCARASASSLSSPAEAILQQCERLVDHRGQALDLGAVREPAFDDRPDGRGGRGGHEVGRQVAVVGAQPGGEGTDELGLLLVEVLTRQLAQCRRAHHHLELAHHRGVGQVLEQHLVHHLTQRLQRSLARRARRDEGGDLVAMGLVVRHDEVDLRIEVAEERAGRDVGGGGDVLDRGGVEALAAEQLERGVDDRLARARLLALAESARRFDNLLHGESMPSLPSACP